MTERNEEGRENQDGLARLVDAIEKTPTSELAVEIRTLRDLRRVTGQEIINSGGYPVLVDIHPEYPSFRAKYNGYWVYAGKYGSKYRVSIDDANSQEIFCEDYSRNSVGRRLWKVLESKLKKVSGASKAKVMAKILGERK